MRTCVLLLIVLVGFAPAQAETIYAAVMGEGIRAIDIQHLSSTLLVHAPTCWYDIAFAPNGRLYGSDAYRLFEIDTVSGKLTLIGSFGSFINGMTFVGDTLYASGDTNLYTIDLLTGHAHMVGSPGYVSAGDLQWFQGALYLTARGMPGDRLLRVDPATGHATLVGEIGYASVFGLAASSSELFGFTQTGELLQIDADSGAGTALGKLDGSVYGASSKPSGVPEPGALLLLGTGLSAVAIRLRRR